MRTPREITAEINQIGQNKAALPTMRMLILAVLAGAYVALAAVGTSAAQATIANLSVAKIIGACVFPAGLAMVTLAGSELFTGNALMVIAALDKKITLRHLLRNWGVVYAGNLVGGLIIALMVVYGHVLSLFGGQMGISTVSAALAKTQLTFGDAFLRGVLCNVLVCLGVWIACAAKTPGGKLAGMFYPIFIFVVCGFEHSVANMYNIPVALFAQMAGVSQGTVTVGDFLLKNLLPVTLGNIVGGTALGSAYYFAYERND